MTQNAPVIAAARANLVALLTARAALDGVVVGYEPPAGHEDLQAAGSDTPAAIWMGAAADGQWDVESIGPTPLRFVETADQVVVMQVLPGDDGDGQEDIEVRLAGMVAELVEVCAADPTLGISAATAGHVHVLPASYSWTAGRMDLGVDGGFAARCEVTLTIRADRC